MKNIQCANCHKTFKIYPEDMGFYNRIKVPCPKLCPGCRQQRRLAWCNEMILYPQKCPLCKKNILSIFSPNSPHNFYCHDCWWSDKWEPLDYAKEIDWNKSIFEQINKLSLITPLAAVSNSGRNTNCDYVHYCGDSKDCYLTFHADFNEKCYYGYGVKKCKDCIDVYNNFNCELCFQCIDCHDSFNIKWSQDCTGCYDGYFLKDCVGCHNCFGAVGLRNQEYYFFDKQLSQEEYDRKIAEINSGSYKEVQNYKQKVKQYQYKKFYKYIQGNKNENSTGNNLYRCKNLLEGFDCSDVENSKYCFQLSLKVKDSYDYYQYGIGSELIYEGTIIGGNCYNLKFCHHCFDKCSDLEYCIECASCKNCFGCISLKKKEFCIFNKQYSESEYFILKEKLIGKMTADSEYGEYFPINHSINAYNETSAAWWFPLNKEEALSQEFNWQDNLPETKGKETITDLSDNIQDVDDNIIKEVLACEKCQKNYKIINQELEYYKNQNLPLPRMCFNCRHLERRSLRNPRSLWYRQCQKPGCSNTFETTYSPDRKELVYCEDCYKKEI